MKKFLLFLFILAALGGAGFFLGWVQLAVPAGSYAVMRSRTHGLDGEVIQNGGLRWVWYKLLPKNVSLVILKLEPLSASFTVSGSLPDGQTYARFADYPADFSWEISGSVTCSVKPESLPGLVDTKGVTDQASFDALTADTLSRVKDLVQSRAVARAADAGLDTKAIASGCLDDMTQAFPWLENADVTLTLARAPDYALYKLTRGLYTAYLTRQEEVFRQEAAVEAERQADSRFLLDRLESYGELLAKYPVLSDFLLKGGIQLLQNTGSVP